MVTTRMPSLRWVVLGGLLGGCDGGGNAGPGSDTSNPGTLTGTGGGGATTDVVPTGGGVDASTAAADDGPGATDAGDPATGPSSSPTSETDATGEPPPPPPPYLPGRSSGIWYSTWYTAQDPYFWQSGHGQGASARMLADVNGDGKADAVAYFGGGDMAGSWYVALSTGAGFGDYSLWASGHGGGSTWQGLADVDGDKRADAVAFFGEGGLAGNWYVATSNGAGFNGYGQWTAGHGGGSTMQGLADVDGDGRADAVAFFREGGLAGNWYVATSNGAGFNGYGQWTAGHGGGSSWQGLADVDGDKRADAVVYFGAGNLAGNWYVATSNGGGFNGYGQWGAGHGVGSTWQGLADIGNDGKADAVVYFGEGGLAGKWYVAQSGGGNFGGGGEWRGPRPSEGGSPPAFVGSADVTGDGTADAVFAFPQGVWTVRRAEGNADFLMENLWVAWGVDYVPNIDGRPYAYDSGDPAIVDHHLASLRAAGFDFILLDLTNNVQTGFIHERALKVRERLKVFNATRHEDDWLRLAVGVGGIQWTHDPNSLEFEADHVFKTFVDEHYQTWQGKPLLVSYMEPADRAAWQQAPNHASTDPFFVGFMQGQVTGPEQAGFFGWGYMDTIPDPEVMGVMPGWNNNKGGPVVLRNQGAFYNQGWRKLMAQRPHLAIVNSFNEFAEETGVEPAYTSGVLGRPPTKEPWVDLHGAPATDFYWQMTVQWNHLYRLGCYAPGTYVRESSKPEVYLFDGADFQYQGALPNDAPVLEIADGTRTPCPAL